MKTCLDDTGLKITVELYRAIEGLKGPMELLSIIGSWGDTLDDEEILSHLRQYNEMGEPWIPDVVAKPSEERWQPIETAPRDKFILAIRAEWWEPINGDHRWTYSKIRETNWMVGSERWDFGNEKQPTHWMPLPAAPHTETGA